VKPAKNRDPVAIKRLQNKIAAKEADIADLTEAIDGVFAAWGELDTQEIDRLVDIAGGEKDRKDSPPPDSGGGMGDGGDIGGGGSADPGRTAAELQAEVNQNVVGFLGGARDLTRGFASNVLANAYAGELGAGAMFPLTGGGSTITVQNFWSQPPADAHLFTKSLEFELKALVA
jgi:hypothetical protein